ncbi:MAG TPA: SMR family transporter [Casimicrobiaceae bacterium]|nr:SMR family transporter [Casimicrobiaceae bacterium]
MPSTELSLGVTLAVLAAGLLHASWNALLKSAAGEPMLDTALIVTWSCLLSFPMLFFVPMIDAAAWPFMLASMIVHFAYYGLLAGAYKRGDLSFAYPLMRGVAPLITTVLGVVFLGERLDAQTLLGIGLISAGILTIAWFAGGKHTGAAAGFALANAAVIAVYTLIDGAGARASGNALSYVLWLTCIEGTPFAAYVLWTRGRPAVDYMKLRWRRGVLGGAASIAAYAIVLWAMTLAPIAVVAALREVSVVFAALIGTLLLKEAMGWRRLAGAVGVVAGIAALKL